VGELHCAAGLKRDTERRQDNALQLNHPIAERKPRLIEFTVNDLVGCAV
jgi:hypothetical protein